MKKEVTRKQHYVPQFYLRQWCGTDDAFYPIRIEKRRPLDLRVFPKKSGPSRFCYENFFYAQHTGKEDAVSQHIEEKFAEIEGIFSLRLPEIEKKILNYQQITEQDKFELAECMLFLHFKGKKYREESKRMSEHMVKEINKRIAWSMGRTEKSKKELAEAGVTREDMVEYAEKGEYTVDMGNIHHMKIMNEMKGFCNLLTAKYWKIYISRSGDFITTDAPYQDIPLSQKFYGNDFLSRQQTFMLSPKVFILALNPKDDSTKRVARKDITDDKNMVMKMNSYNLMHSISFGFHQNRDLLLEVEKTAHILERLYSV